MKIETIPSITKNKQTSTIAAIKIILPVLFTGASVLPGFSTWISPLLFGIGSAVAFAGPFDTSGVLYGVVSGVLVDTAAELEFISAVLSVAFANIVHTTVIHNIKHNKINIFFT